MMTPSAPPASQENIITKQIVWGKEFKGVAFFPKPAIIQFKDFDVGKVYTRKIVLTNISYTFNAFKLLALPDAIRDFFKISYPLQGAMSAGRDFSPLARFPSLLPSFCTTGYQIPSLSLCSCNCIWHPSPMFSRPSCLCPCWRQVCLCS